MPSDKLYYSYKTDDDVTLKFHNSFLLTGDFYFSDDHKFRPFAGAGAGLHLISSNPFTDDKSTVSKFGEMLRAGIALRKCRIAVEYNFVPKTEINGQYSVGGEVVFVHSVIAILI